MNKLSLLTTALLVTTGSIFGMQERNGNQPNNAPRAIRIRLQNPHTGMAKKISSALDKENATNVNFQTIYADFYTWFAYFGSNHDIQQARNNAPRLRALYNEVSTLAPANDESTLNELNRNITNIEDWLNGRPTVYTFIVNNQ